MTGDKKIIAEWRRNDRETVRVSLGQFKDQPIVDVRVWWRNDAGELRPSRRGLTLSVRHLPTLARALADAEQNARELGWLPILKGAPFQN